MDEDLEMEEQNAETELPVEAMNLPGLVPTNPAAAALLSKYETAMGAESSALQQAARSREARFKAAEEAIRKQRFGAPTQSQQLFALSQALLSPRQYRGLAGTLANVVPALGEMSSLQSKAESQRTAALEQLRQQYATADADARVAMASAQREGIGKILPSVLTATGAANRSRFAVEINPDTGVETFKNFAVPVAAVNALLYALQTPGATEQQKADTVKDFETHYKVPAATFTEGMR